MDDNTFVNIDIDIQTGNKRIGKDKNSLKRSISFYCEKWRIGAKEV